MACKTISLTKYMAQSQVTKLVVGVVSSDTAFWCVVFLVCALLTCAITNSSLWIDEGYSAWIADHRTISSAMLSLAQGDSSDRQMAPHYLYLWGWTKIFGSGEYSVRAANIPFGVLFVVSVALTSWYGFGRRFVWVVAASCPFVWFHMNEARAYMMLMGLSAACTGSLLIHTYGSPDLRRRTAWICALFVSLALATHLLAIFILPALTMVILSNHREIDFGHWRYPVFFLIPATVALTLYYIWASGGFRAPNEKPTLAHCAAALYEHLGFGGLGPSRNVIRSGLASAELWDWPWIVIGLLMWAYVLSGCLRRRYDGRVKAVAIAWFVAYLCACATSYIVNSRLVGRHFAALVPLMLFLLIASIPHFRYWIALAVVWIAADVRLGSLPAYQKDDYRGAVQFLSEILRSRPGAVAWVADSLTADYYGLRLQDPHGIPGYSLDYSTAISRVNRPIRLNGTDVRNWMHPDIHKFLEDHRNRGLSVYVALSKPLLYDVTKGWMYSIRHCGRPPVATFQSFEIFELAPSCMDSLGP